jgi:hypothetical protein
LAEANPSDVLGLLRAGLGARSLRAERLGVRVLLLGWPLGLVELLAVASRVPELSFTLLCPVYSPHTPSAGPWLQKQYGSRLAHVPCDPLDRRQLARHVLSPGLHSVVVFDEFLRRGEPSADRMDVSVCAANVESLLASSEGSMLAGGGGGGLSSGRVQLIVSLASAADMRFVDRTGWWPSSADPLHSHVSSPTFASGAVASDEAWVPLQMGWVKDGLIELCTRLSDSVHDAIELRLLDMPPQLAARADGTARTWGEAAALVVEIGGLAIGLYRQRLGLGARFMPPYVLPNPPNATPLRKTDRLYALVRTAGADERSYSSVGRALERAARARECLPRRSAYRTVLALSSWRPEFHAASVARAWLRWQRALGNSEARTELAVTRGVIRSSAYWEDDAKTAAAGASTARDAKHEAERSPAGPPARGASDAEAEACDDGARGSDGAVAAAVVGLRERRHLRNSGKHSICQPVSQALRVQTRISGQRFLSSSGFPTFRHHTVTPTLSVQPHRDRSTHGRTVGYARG